MNEANTVTTSHLFDDLATVRLSLAALTDEMSALQARESEIRAALHVLMQTEGIKTAEGSGLQAVRSNRKTITVTDRVALQQHLVDCGLYNAYIKFDEVAAKKDAVKHEWPGVEQSVTDVFSIREIKA